MREKTVESGEVSEIFKKPLHPYTKALLEAVEQLNEGTERLKMVAGSVPQPGEKCVGCKFQNDAIVQRQCVKNVTQNLLCVLTEDRLDVGKERKNMLKVNNLTKVFSLEKNNLSKGQNSFKAVNDVCLNIKEGEIFSIVGESGSGKSVSVKTIMGITAPNAVIESGTIKFRFKENGKEQVVDLLKLSKKEMQHRIKGKRIAMVFQDPMTSLDPTMTIGRQLTEGMRYHLHLSQADADKRAEELLEMVGIESPKERMKNYPHQLSGGMRQRVVIAIALSCNPDLLICDEPTTALDVTIQARILQLILNLQKKLGIAVILSHITLV